MRKASSKGTSLFFFPEAPLIASPVHPRELPLLLIAGEALLQELLAKEAAHPAPTAWGKAGSSLVESSRCLVWVGFFFSVGFGRFLCLFFFQSGGRN